MSGGFPSTDISRTQSFKSGLISHRVFKPSDLIDRELLGRGFYGQVYKVREQKSKNA